MKRFRATIKFKDGSVQRVTTVAKDRDDAARIFDELNAKRPARADLNAARLDMVADTGEPGMLPVDPKFAGAALTEAWVKAEKERRKRDFGRYDKDFTMRIEEVG